MTWKWTWRETLKHQFFDCLYLVGLRSRLRCPKCRAVGTFKPYGGFFNLIAGWWLDSKRSLLPGVPYSTDRRWVCKYCGYVRDTGGEKQGYPNMAKKVWDAKCADSVPTPKELVDPVWPWLG